MVPTTLILPFWCIVKSLKRKNKENEMNTVLFIVNVILERQDICVQIIYNIGSYIRGIK